MLQLRRANELQVGLIHVVRQLQRVPHDVARLLRGALLGVGDSVMALPADLQLQGWSWRTAWVLGMLGFASQLLFTQLQLLLQLLQRL